jgi:excisionase family DNA binding protein
MTDRQVGSEHESAATTESRQGPSSPWLTVKEAAARARCGVKTIYREVEARRLRAARLGGRRELRLLPEWVDQWLLESTTPRVA